MVLIRKPDPADGDIGSIRQKMLAGPAGFCELDTTWKCFGVFQNPVKKEGP
jgi:hypothetical protein